MWHSDCDQSHKVSCGNSHLCILSASKCSGFSTCPHVSQLWEPPVSPLSSLSQEHRESKWGWCVGWECHPESSLEPWGPRPASLNSSMLVQRLGCRRVRDPNLSRVGLSLPAFRCSAVPTGLGPSRLCIAGTQAPLHSEVDLARGAAGLSAACGGTWKDSWGRGS